MNAVVSVAHAFASALAKGTGAEFVDETGEPLAISVPVDGGGQATLTFNNTGHCWVLSVERSLAPLSPEVLEDYLEDLIIRTNLQRFSTAEVAGLTASGDLSLSVALPRDADERLISEVLTHLLDLNPQTDANSAPSHDAGSGPDPSSWLRV